MKKINISLIICLILSIFSIHGEAYDKVQIPEYIKIGLRFKESAVPLVYMNSEAVIDIGTFEGNKFKQIMSFSGKEGIVVRKESYFLNLNGSFIEYEFDKQRDFNNLMVQGPIHIQIGNIFTSQEEAQGFLNTLQDAGIQAYLAYEDGWKVWEGTYISEEQAYVGMEKIEEVVSNMELSIVSASEKRIQILTNSGNLRLILNTQIEDYYFNSSVEGGNVIKVDGKNFRGSIGVKRYTGSDLTIVNRMQLEEYLYGVVPKEMSGTWPIEAQKAQAVAARNYAIQNINKHRDLNFDLCTVSHCQVYGGYDSEHERSTKAVDETKGKVLTYDGKLVSAFYHSNSGGHTENSENVWTNSIGYIRGVDDTYSVGAPNDTWSYILTKEQIEGILNSKSLSVGELLGIHIVESSDFGRVIKLQIDGTTGSKIIEKEKVRSIFGYNNIKSTWFKISSGEGVNIITGLSTSTQDMNVSNSYVLSANGVETIETSTTQYIVYNGEDYSTLNQNSAGYVFTGKGWGHGLGMSQWGAKKMAESGFSFEEILTYYYQGTKLE